jgi:GMP reductase
MSKMDPTMFMVSTGIDHSKLDNLKEIIDYTNCSWICVDVANGYMKTMVEYCRTLRKMFPAKILVAGNVATREVVEELIINGKVDVVKVGIGGGSGCLTRKKTGVGIPQLSAIIECADAAHGLNGFIIGDGGITCPGDAVKAFGGGADFVMLGGEFAGHDENPGEIEVDERGDKWKLFYGMSSELAMKKHYGGMESYRSSEGRVIRIKYKGELINTVNDYLGGIRSACTYINARCIKNVPKCCTFVVVHNQLNTSLVQ